MKFKNDILTSCLTPRIALCTDDDDDDDDYDVYDDDDDDGVKYMCELKLSALLWYLSPSPLIPGTPQRHHVFVCVRDIRCAAHVDDDDGYA